MEMLHIWVVADNFAGDESFGADRKLDMKVKMKAYVKEVQKLSADAKKAVGATGGPSFGAGAKRPMPPRRNRGGGAGVGGTALFLLASPSQVLTPMKNSSGPRRGRSCASTAIRRGISHGTARINRAASSPPKGVSPTT
jgi:hypothetical protein